MGVVSWSSGVDLVAGDESNESVIRTADGIPAVYSEDRIPSSLLADFEGAALDTSLYVILAQAGLTIHHAVATLRPVIADTRLARLLAVPRGSALQYIEQVDFTAHLGNLNDCGEPGESAAHHYDFRSCHSV